MLASENTAKRRVAFDYVTKFVRRMNDAGVTITVGSDSGAGNIAYGWGTHHELEALVEDGGLTRARRRLPPQGPTPPVSSPTTPTSGRLPRARPPT